MRLLSVLLAVALCCGTLLAQASHNKSWIWMDPAASSRVLTSGETWEIPVEYELDPTEASLARTIELFVPGPWIDGPDGKYTKDRFHVTYPGMGASIPVTQGRHREVVRLTVPPAHPNGNSLLVIAAFSGPQGRWPWETRMGGTWFKRSGGDFDLTSAVPGHLFTYDQPVVFTAKLLRKDGAGKNLTWRVINPAGEAVATGSQALGDAAEVKLPIELSARGIFLLEAEIVGWEKRVISFGRIPDVGPARIEPTRFGMTDVLQSKAPERIENEAAIARRLGLSVCRIMSRWDNLEPGRGVYKLDALDASFDVARKYGIQPVLMVDHPPAWAQRGAPRNIQYAPFEADWDGWRTFVDTATRRFGDRLYAWEWLNEIVPGDDPNAVANYIKLCQIGTETAKEANPDVVITAAGGLWPRSFRNALLAGGLAKHIDVLPVHYSDGSGIRQAKSDLRAVGSDMPVWDNETSAVVNAWDVPKLEQIADRTQPRYLLTRWTDCLSAGAERIFWFGGQGDPAGNWSYLLDDHTPRPVAISIAVLVSKLHNATPLGAFTLGNDSKLHLFERDGKPIVVAWSPRPANVMLPATGEAVTQTNYLGNESRVSTADKVAEVALSDMPVFIEGLDLDQLKLLVSLRSLASEDPTQQSRLTLLAGRQMPVQLEVRNLFARELTGEVSLATGEQPLGAVKFALAAGERRVLEVPVKVDAGQDVQLVATLQTTNGNPVRLPMLATVVSPELMGNLLPNGDFEQGDGTKPAQWNGSGQRVSAEGFGEGLGQWLLKFENTPETYRDMTGSIKLAGGHTYLYSAWVRNEDMQAGSNIGMTMRDGSTRILYNVQVFVTPTTNLNWQLYTAKLNAPAEMVAASFTPVVKGAGFAMFDNVRVTRYEGTDYMAEAHRAPAAIKVDGDLSEWNKRCPIPLIGANQLTADKPHSPENLSGVAYAAWDDANLYIAMRVQDQQHTPAAGDQAPSGDSVVIAIDPTGRKADAQERSFAYYLCSAVPGGGSGKHTLFRPATQSGGLSTGHLLKDSSVYDLSIRHEGGATIYEARLPWSELGVSAPAVGTRIGLTLQLNDNDGGGREARMHWGAGIEPTWHAMNFGLLTLMD